MAKVAKVDSNITGLRYAQEVSLGKLSETPIWKVVEPNSYNDFGGEISTVARNPINPSRQRKKGVVTDLDASGGFQIDLTQTNSLDLLESFFFAARRGKASQSVTAVDTGAFTVASTAGFTAGALVLASGFSTAANNGVKVVDSVVEDDSVTVAGASADEAAPPAGAKLALVGYEGEAGDFDVDVSGLRPAITSTVLDFTTLGLIPGEWMFVGDDDNGFATEANNGYKRIRRIQPNRLEFDKTAMTMVDEDGSALTVRFYLGTTIRNETEDLIKRHPLQFERTMGKSDTAPATKVQAEYLVGSVANQMTLNIPTADKLTADLTFLSLDSEQRTSSEGPKSGERPTLKSENAFNTSSDFTRLKLARVYEDQAAPEPLFAFVTDVTLTINNNLSGNKAVGVLGSFDVSAGTFEVSGDITAYFSDVDAVAAVRENADVTLDFAIFNNNAGIIADIPLTTLGNGRAEVTQDEPITLPLSYDAATAASIDTDLDYTLQLTFFDYLPDSADV